MSDHQYEMKYDGGVARQVNIPADAPVPTSSAMTQSGRKRFVMPESIKSALLIGSGIAAVLSAEILLPPGWRPTDRLGIADARLEAYHVTAEKQAQAQVEAFTRATDVANQQNIERYKALIEAQIKNYDATYQRTQIYAEATARMQQSLVQTRMELTRSTQGTDVSVINFSRLFGRVANAVEPGAGDSALSYADNLRTELYGELDASVKTGTTVSIEGWNTDLPSPQSVRAQFENFKFAPLPPAPTIGISPPSKMIVGK